MTKFGVGLLAIGLLLAANGGNAGAETPTWQCPLPNGSPSGALVINGPDQTNTFLVSVFAANSTICFDPAPKTLCPVIGLRMFWIDTTGKKHAVLANNQYTFAVSVRLPAKGTLRYSCPAAPTPIVGDFHLSPTTGVENLDAGITDFEGTPAPEGILYRNGSGAPQSLYLTVNHNGPQPPSNFVLGWKDGAGHHQSMRLAGLSAGLALTVANGGDIRYTGGSPNWAITPAASAEASRSGHRGAIECGTQGEPLTGSLFTNMTASPVALILNVFAFESLGGSPLKALTLKWTNPVGTPATAQLNGLGGAAVPVSLGPGQAVRYACGTAQAFFWTIAQ